MSHRCLFPVSFLKRLAGAALLCLGAGSLAAEPPVVEWVSPPAWLQTPKQIVPAQPGMKITESAWLVTGRGGEVAVVAGQDLVLVESDGVWHWPGPDTVGSGNAIQGNVRIRSANARTLQAEEKRLLATSPMPLQREAAAWVLFLRTGSDPQTAQALNSFLNGNGYPVRLASPNGAPAGSPGGWLALDGFKSEDSARAAGEHLAKNIPWIESFLARKKAP